MTPSKAVVRDDPQMNPNSLHDFHRARRGPKNVPEIVMSTPIEEATATESPAKNPGHGHATTRHIQFALFDQRTSNAPFGYEHFVSLPPGYDDGEHEGRKWPLILFLHGAGESQRAANESYASIRHGIPKVILCYDKIKCAYSSSLGTGGDHDVSPSRLSPALDIPMAPRLRKSTPLRQVDLNTNTHNNDDEDKDKDNINRDRSSEPVPTESCLLVAENFITVSPSLNMTHGYGWNAAILPALLDEVVTRYRIDRDRIHVTGFSMGGYGAWDLALYSPRRFATVVPVCGGGDTVRVAASLRHVPHWVFHGACDDVIPIRASEQMIAALEHADNPQATEVKFTRYPDLTHDSWTDTYNNPELYRWMLSHTRQVSGDEQVVPEENKVILA